MRELDMGVAEIPLLAEQAIRAMLYEVCVNPKPGLVDPSSSGPHPDMDVFMFIDSAETLRAYFERCAAIGADTGISTHPDMFQALRPLGVSAERAMLEATAGANTHKGAIFSLGILVASTARASLTSADIRSTVRIMMAGVCAADFAGTSSKPARELTAGEKQYLLLGATGVRGEAEAGFPCVFDFGLPALRGARGTRNQRLLDTLMAIAAHETDSNLLSRSGMDQAIVLWAQRQAQAVLDAGGAAAPAGLAALQDMNHEFLKRNLSLGGAADMLILTIFLGLREGLLAHL
ncbi:triphosphoribosyl-dephospho-CoA synthase CitG [Coriobacterium glomerans PW2]|uniref:Probable 2-(5''-triphosphoribosyl)-3'-dephosphocoenzyme-A synthase n=1 Tax=Coriobacterium glomerans (strain ATCC 49209 / DSM 20642 / JCM 10262 / PW2) TaxID=700015 RepID=F2NBF7_CORGP|nr:triphosphoribosyl-dephospho-CoA synthase [Coriobacterium glomerans]AEB06693.1 triphosphoribosyl-dephospho-CoA synthase CitG [Coriobacterium glomerans PW2]